MENSPLDPVETHYEAAKRTLADESSPAAHPAGTTFIGRTGRDGTHACRSIGKTQDGTSDSGDAPGADAAVDGFVGCLSGGRLHRAVMSCGGRFERRGAGTGQLRAPFVGTAACPARATSRCGAHFTPGGDQDRGIGRNGRWGRRNAIGRDDRGRNVTATRVARCNLEGRCTPRAGLQGQEAGNRSGRDSPLAVHTRLRTPASSRSDRRPDARRRR